MLTIDPDGWVSDPKVNVTRRPNLQHWRMATVSGIIVHQTGAPTAQSTLNSDLQPRANGAHFLIDRDGQIYQTGSVFWKQWHVGKLRARCLAEHTCNPIEAKSLARMGASATNEHEKVKSVPDRYPSNDDSIGIELVAGTHGDAKNLDYDTATDAQNGSLGWLISQLRENFKVPLTEIFRHPQVSYKDEHEAESARW